MTLKTSTYLIATMILTIVYPIDGQWNQLNVTFCPDPDLPRGWEDANKKHCLNPSKILHCQTNHGENIIYSMCAEQQRCGKGTHAHLNFAMQAVECTVCSPDFFQPEAKESQKYTQPNCDRKKQTCGDGKEVCEEATAFQDYKCRCIHEQGYFPEQNNCDCFTYDSTCTCGYCEEGKEVVNGTKCVTITTSSTTTTTAPTTTTTTATTTTTTTSDQALTVGISIGTVLSVIVIIIFILWCLQRKGIIKKKIFGGCKVCGDTEKAQHNDTTDSNTHASRPSQNGTADPSLSMNGFNEQPLEPTAPPGLAPSEPDNTENFGTNPEGQQPRATSDSSLQENQERAPLLPSKPICSESNTESMLLVSSHIGKDWKKLGRKLGLSDGELETLNMDHKGEGQEEIVYQMLRKWNTGSYPGTLTLAQACVEIGKGNIAKRLKNLESAKQQ